ncbi:MAG: TetR/AcrR family transcriptional regulator [Gemmatimonadota bacterium]|nr:TetR/AcrR family transcriptional regulator [Gemmatimonadota bacterium]MDH4351605.1 TetR/AcrR family transcriptional regulator [Gemmatimonadota bacterium]MDH5198826.1 TetR/AcrR family transcriptional regulator [Gemmatimonadota bacterium]
MRSGPGLRERKNAAVKEAFFEAALALFREKGFEETSVDEIADRAGFSRATFFNHFGTKQGVLRYYGQRLQSQMEHLLREADPSSSPLERIREMLLVMAREADRLGEEVRLIYLISMQDLDYFARPTDARMRVLEMVRELVVEAQERAAVRRDLSASQLALHMLTVYNSAILAAISGWGRAEHLVQSAWEFILDGVRGGDRLDH